MGGKWRRHHRWWRCHNRRHWIHWWPMSKSRAVEGALTGWVRFEPQYHNEMIQQIAGRSVCGRRLWKRLDVMGIISNYWTWILSLIYTTYIYIYVYIYIYIDTYMYSIHVCTIIYVTRTKTFFVIVAFIKCWLYLVSDFWKFLLYVVTEKYDGLWMISCSVKHCYGDF